MISNCSKIFQKNFIAHEKIKIIENSLIEDFIFYIGITGMFMMRLDNRSSCVYVYFLWDEYEKCVRESNGWSKGDYGIK